MFKELEVTMQNVINQYEPENPRPVLEQVSLLLLTFGMPNERYQMRVTSNEYCTPERAFRELKLAFETTSESAWMFHAAEAYQIIKYILGENLV